jgi:hypothetical protein
VAISAEQCKEMYAQKVYKDHWHQATPLDTGMTNIIRKELIGSTNPWGGGDTKCVGAIYQQNGLDIPDKKKKESPKKISNRSGRLPDSSLSLSLSQPTNWSFLDQIRSVLLWRRNTVSPG